MSASVSILHQMARSEAERIHVYARVRPAVSAAAAESPWVTVDATSTTLRCGEAESGLTRAAAQASGKPGRLLPSRSGPAAAAATGTSGGGGAPQSFTLDGVVGDMWDVSTNAFLEQAARSCVVDGLLRGTNATVLCCGEKSSGKSTTLFGNAATPGLCQRLFTALFASIEAEAETAAAAAAAATLLSSSRSPAGGAATAGGPPPFRFGTAPHVVGEDATEVQRSMQTRHLVQLSCLALRGETVSDFAAEAAAAEHGGGGGGSGGVSSSHTEPMLFSASSLSSSLRNSALHSPSASASAFTPAVKPTISLDPRGELILRNVVKVTCRSAAEAVAMVERCRRGRSAPSNGLSGPESQQQQQQQQSNGGVSGGTASSALAHMIVMVDVTSEEGETGNAYHHVVRQARLHLVDLASAPPAPPRNIGGGSGGPAPSASSGEPLSLGSRAEEAAIRQSLATLQEVVAHLSSSAAVATAVADSPRASVAPYKQSKLTMLLKDHLGGTCRTLVIAHVRPEEAHKRETLSTLQLARRLLCVTERPTTRVTEDPEVRLRQLQRQVAHLQLELRVQMELNAAATVAAHSAITALSPTSPAAASSLSATPGTSKSARRRPGDSSEDSARARQSSSQPASPHNANGHGARGRADNRANAAQRLATADSAATATADCHPLLHRSASTATSASAATLATAVKEFIAGRLAVLPVTTVMEMHTCFELLRQCIVEREMQLNAALTDTRTAETAAAAALTTLATTATVTVTSAHSSVSGRSPSSNRLGGNGGGGGGGGGSALRRRTGSARGSFVGASPDTKRRASLESMSPSASTATQPPTLVVSRSLLLRETSPSTAAAAGGRGRNGTREGKGFGSGVPATAAAAAAARAHRGIETVSASSGGGSVGAPQLASPPSFPSSAPLLPPAGHAWPAAQMASAAFSSSADRDARKALRRSDAPLDDTPSSAALAPHGSRQGGAVPFTSLSAGRRSSPSSQQQHHHHSGASGGGSSGGGGTSPLLVGDLDGGSTWGSGPRGPPSPFGTTTGPTPFGSGRGWRPQSAPVGTIAGRMTPNFSSTPPASPQESKAFHVFTTQTAEGAHQVAQVRQVEELLAGLRQRLSTAPGVWLSGSPPGSAAASAESASQPNGPPNSPSPLSLMEECRYQEAQLTRRREELLRSFEVWYTRRSTATATTATTVVGNMAGIARSGAATPVSPSVSAPSPWVRPGWPTAPPSPQLSIQAMKRRLHRPATANAAGSILVDGSTPRGTNGFAAAPMQSSVMTSTTPVRDGTP